MAKILVVEDDPEIAKVVVDCLSADNHRVEHSSDGIDAMERLLCSDYDIAVLDWNVPGKTGVEIATGFRAQGGKTPILMLTGNSLSSHKVTGLDAGADDYLVKPFNLDELRARIRALLRRSGVLLQTNILKVGSLELNPDTFTVICRGAGVSLVPKEFQLLEFFMRHPNIVFSPEALLRRVWTLDEEASPETIRTYVKNLRKKLDAEGEPSVLENIRGIGYKLVAPNG